MRRPLSTKHVARELAEQNAILVGFVKIKAVDGPWICERKPRKLE